MFGLYWSQVAAQQIFPLYKTVAQWNQLLIALGNIFYLLDHLFHFDIHQGRKQRLALEIVSRYYQFFIINTKAVNISSHCTTDFSLMFGPNVSLNEVLNIYVVFPIVYLYIPIFKVIDEKAIMVVCEKKWNTLSCRNARRLCTTFLNKHSSV